jgi:hypothetical protein
MERPSMGQVPEEGEDVSGVQQEVIEGYLELEAVLAANRGEL